MDKIIKYGAHALTYALSVALIVAGTSPASIPATWLPWIGAAGVVAGVGHNALTAGQPQPGTIQTVAKSFAGAVLACMLGAVMLVSMSACKTAPTAQQQSAAIVAVNIAAGQAIQRNDHDPAVWKARATQYKAIAVQIQTVNDSGSATIATLAADLQPAIAKLGPSDQLAANALIAAVTPYLQDKVNSSDQVAHTREAVAVILSAVIKACEAYGA